MVCHTDMRAGWCAQRTPMSFTRNGSTGTRIVKEHCARKMMVNGPKISDCRSPQLFGLKLTALNAPSGRLICTGTHISVSARLIV